MSLVSRIICIFLFLTLTVPARSAGVSAPKFDVTDLGTLPGYDALYARSINDHGDIVGYAYTGDKAFDIPLKTVPFIWSKGQLRKLNTMPEKSYNVATAINDSGVIIGAVYSLSMEAVDTQPLIVWRHGVPQLLPIRVGLHPIGLNNSGDIAGTVIRQYGQRVTFIRRGEKVRYLASEKDLPNTEAAGLNGVGEIVGTLSSDDIKVTMERAFIYAGGRIRRIGTLGGDRSNGYAINERGQVVGAATTRKHDEHLNAIEHAFLWDAHSGIHDLGSLGGTYTEAFSINNQGQVVGNSQTAQDATEYAVLWQNGKVYDLNKLIPPHPAYILSEAVKINDHGQIITSGFINYKRHSFLLTPK